jgi:hypothetical protein
MRRVVSRRWFLGTGSVLIVPALPIAAQPAPGSTDKPGAAARPGSAADGPTGGVAASFPTQDPALVREMVGVSHGNLARVKELVERQPALARATYDWGFGDWESALDAASHVGNRDIALFLIANGARPTIFSAAMLGQLDIVKAFVAASPGVQRTLGPHGITLLAHAAAGREPARPVLEYLEQLGDANPRLESPPLTDAEIATLSGTYQYGPSASERIVIDVVKGHLGFMRTATTRRGLIARGPREFSPVGAPAVRIKFVVEGEGVAARAVRLTVHDPDVMLTAIRAPERA